MRLLPLVLVLSLAGCGVHGASGAATKAGFRAQAQSKEGIMAAFIASAQRAIARMDLDGNGMLSRSEAKGSLSGGFDTIDADGDGQLRWQEMVSHEATPEMLAYIHDELMAAFAAADQNRNKLLDEKEFAWARENPIFYTSKLRAEDFAAADTNRDGKLTANEFENRAAATSL